MAVSLRNLPSVAVALICAFALQACRAEENPEKLRYSIAAADGWPVVVFLTDSNLAVPRMAPSGTFRSSGWDQRYGSTPARLGGQVAEDGAVRMDLLWYEVVTGAAFAARVEFDPAGLARDPIWRDSGTLILRIGGSGYVEAVTYADTYPPADDLPEAEVVAWVCAEQVVISDPAYEKALDRALTEPLNQHPNRRIADIADLPGTCKGDPD